MDDDWNWSKMKNEADPIPHPHHPEIAHALEEIVPKDSYITVQRYNAAVELAAERVFRKSILPPMGTMILTKDTVAIDGITVKSSPDPQEREIAAAMVTIQMMRAKFSSTTCGEAWRRLGGAQAMIEWRDRTRPMPNGPVKVDLRADEAEIRKSIAVLRAAQVPGRMDKKEFYAKEYDTIFSAPGCRCSSCRAAQTPGADAAEVDVIVKNLSRCTPPSVTTALRLLAGVNGPCAFCGAAGAVAHAPYCPFYVGSAPIPYTPPSIPSPVSRNVYTPLPTVSTRGTTLVKPASASLPASTPAARPKDSLLNPAPKGFAGSRNLPYDADVDG